MTTKIDITGLAGQGVLWLGKQIAKKVLTNNRHLNVTYLAEYQAGVRTGKSRSQLIISDKPISCPFVSHPGIKVKLEDGILRCGTQSYKLEFKEKINEAALEMLFDKTECKQLVKL